MSPDFLLQHWDRLLSARGAVFGLRRLILDLAVRGQLTADWRSQNPNVEPASKLLERIRQQKAVLIKAKKLRAERPLPEIKENDFPYVVPTTWRWCRLIELCSKTGSGSTPSGGKTAYSDDGIPFLRSQNVHDHGLELDDVALISEAIHQSMHGTRVCPGDLLLNITGGSIGRCAVVPADLPEANVSQHVAIIRPVEPEFARYLHIKIRSGPFKSQTDEAQTGAGREGLPKNKMDLFLIALPPLAEQAAIAKRVGALMTLCDRLESTQRERDGLRNRYLAAGYASLAERADNAASVDATELLNRSTEAGQLKLLQQLILTLAIRGDLTADWRAAHPDVEPANQLLHRIQAEKARLIAAKKLRPEKPLPKITAAEVPFEIPEGWEWCRLGAMIEEKPRNGVSLKPVDYETSAKTLKLSATSSGTFDGSQVKYLDLEVEANSYLWLRNGDILIQRANSLDFVGTAAVYRGAESEFIYPDLMMKCRAVFSESTDYLHHVLSARVTRDYFKSKASGSAGNMPKVNQETVTNTLIPLPPLAEQAAIVERVEALMTTCRALEAEIEQARRHAAQLLQAVLKEAFAPTAPAG